MTATSATAPSQQLPLPSDKAKHPRHSLRALIVLGTLLCASTCATRGGTNDVEALNQRVTSLYEQGKYQEALSLASNAVQLAQAASGLDNTNTAAAFQNLADIHRQLAHFKPAEELYRQCLKIREKVAWA